MTDSLNTIQFYNTTITSIVSSDNAVNAGRGTTDTLWIRDAIIKIGQYNSLIAWLKEAIKNKMKHLKNYQVHVFKIGQNIKIILLLNHQVKKLR